MAKKVTIKDIALEMNTAYSTVSRALNNQQGVGAEMRKKIFTKAKEMGYEPNTIAQQLRKGHGNTIGLIVPRINRHFFSNVIHGVETVAKQKGYNVIITQSNELAEDEISSIRALVSNHVAGVIVSLSAGTISANPFKEIQEKKIPLVMFDRTFKDLDVHRVVNDNFKGAYEATQHLIKGGYKKILHFGGPMQINIYRERLEGYKAALRDAGLPLDDNRIFMDVITRDKGFEAVQTALQKGIGFDAVHASGDYSALGAMQCLQSKGIKIPEEVGLVGVANEPFTELIGLSSLEQFSEEIGRGAAQLLFEDIERKADKMVAREVVIPPKLICRNSSSTKKK